MVGGSGKVEGLCGGGGHAVVTWTVEAQSPLKVQELAHEVKVGGDVRLLHLDNVVGIIHGEVELLHEVGHGDSNRPAYAGQTVDQDSTLLTTSLINKANSFGEELREILAPVVGDGDLLVLKLPSILK